MAPSELTQQLIVHYYATFNSGDRSAMLDLLTDNVVHDINQGASEAGREAFGTFLQRMDRCYCEEVVELVVMPSADGKHAAAEFFILGSYEKTDEGLPPASGQRYRLRVGAFFEVKEGKVARVTNYYNLQDWLTQVDAA